MTEDHRWWRRWSHGGVGDAVLAAVVGVLVVVTTVVSWDPAVGFRSVPPIGWVLALAASAALAWRRRFPVVVAFVTLVANMVFYPFVDADGALLVTLVVALYTLAAEGRLWVAVGVSALATVGSGIGEYATDASPLGDAGMFLLVGWLVAAVAVGAVSRSRRDYLNEAARRVREAERNRAEALRREATEERLRIARELHDVLGHNISLINVQAGAALHGLERDPDQAAAALTAIRESSREALRELRSTLGVLRQVDEDAPTSPPPGLGRLEELARHTRSAGLAVDVRTSGEPGDITPAVDLAGFRIVQEALTNVTRHAAASHAVVRVAYGSDDVTVDVEDDGPGRKGGSAGEARPARQSGPAEPGHGIRGMAERARAVGGELDAGERPEGGFRVRARLPRRSVG